MENFKTEVRDGMRIDWDVPVKMEDGLVLRADVYRPLDEAKKYPVILTCGPYGKGLAFQDGYKAASSGAAGARETPSATRLNGDACWATAVRATRSFTGRSRLMCALAA